VATVEIYTKASCGFCTRAKRMLEMKKVEFREIPIDRGGAPREEMIQRANGRSTVPQIFIDGRHIGGCDDLMGPEYDGKLDALLAA
jgi:glutaredoxin 3